MKLSKLIVLILVTTFIFTRAISQNVLINILTQNGGIVKKGQTIFLEITLNNTDPAAMVGMYKIRPQISVPKSIVEIPTTGHVLPAGWTIISNDGSAIRFSNGTDSIAAHDARTILIAIKGKTGGGPSTISGTLLFSNGETPGTEPGALKGDNPADNISTTTCQVVR